MNVIVLGLRGFPNVQGGVEKHAEELYPRLVDLGCEVEVIARSSHVPAERKSWRGVRLFRLWAPPYKGVEAFIHSIMSVFYAAYKRPDILHIHAVGPAIATPLARLFKLRVVVTHHGPDYDREKWGGFARRLLRLGEAWGMKYSNGRIVITEVISNMMIEKYHISPVVIPNGVTLPEMPKGVGALTRLSLEPERYILLVSRFVPEKRHADLIEAFSRCDLPGWKLVLVGKVDNNDRYSMSVVSHAARTPGVIIAGFHTGESLQELYAHAGMFVLPSSHEGLPIAMLEALSYGVPVIASDIPANLEVGLPDCQYYCLGNVQALADTISRLSMKKYSHKDRMASRLWIKDRHDWNKIAEKTLRVYKQVISPTYKYDGDVTESLPDKQESTEIN